MLLQPTDLLIGRAALQAGTLALQGVQLGLRVAQPDLAYFAASVSGNETGPKLCSLPIECAQAKAGLVTGKQRLAGSRALIPRLDAVLRRSHTLLCKFRPLILIARGIAA